MVQTVHVTFLYVAGRSIILQSTQLSGLVQGHLPSDLLSAGAGGRRPCAHSSTRNQLSKGILTPQNYLRTIESTHICCRTRVSDALRAQRAPLNLHCLRYRHGRQRFAKRHSSGALVGKSSGPPSPVCRVRRRGLLAAEGRFLLRTGLGLRSCINEQG